MNERLVCINLPVVYPGASAALGADYATFYAPCDLTIVYVSAAPSADDTGATLDIEDDGTAVIDDVDVSDADAPGTWKAVGYGGSETPVTIAAGSKISLTAATIENGVQIVGQIWALTASVFS